MANDYYKPSLLWSIIITYLPQFMYLPLCRIWLILVIISWLRPGIIWLKNCCAACYCLLRKKWPFRWLTWCAIYKADGAYLSSIAIELILFGKLLANHDLVLSSFKERGISIAAKTEGLDKLWVFIWRLCRKYYEIFCDNFKNIDVVEFMLRK